MSYLLILSSLWAEAPKLNQELLLGSMAAYGLEEAEALSLDKKSMLDDPHQSIFVEDKRTNISNLMYLSAGSYGHFFPAISSIQLDPKDFYHNLKEIVRFAKENKRIGFRDKFKSHKDSYKLKKNIDVKFGYSIEPYIRVESNVAFNDKSSIPPVFQTLNRLVTKKYRIQKYRRLIKINKEYFLLEWLGKNKLQFIPLCWDKSLNNIFQLTDEQLFNIAETVKMAAELFADKTGIRKANLTLMGHSTDYISWSVMLNGPVGLFIHDQVCMKIAESLGSPLTADEAILKKSDDSPQFLQELPEGLGKKLEWASNLKEINRLMEENYKFTHSSPKANKLTINLNNIFNEYYKSEDRINRVKKYQEELENLNNLHHSGYKTYSTDYYSRKKNLEKLEANHYINKMKDKLDKVIKEAAIEEQIQPIVDNSSLISKSSLEINKSIWQRLIDFLKNSLKDIKAFFRW